jgi:hypothetical protein
MENGSSVWTIVAYAVICIFLLLLVVVLARTMLLFSVLTLMPLARVLRVFPPFRRRLDGWMARAATDDRKTRR